MTFKQHLIDIGACKEALIWAGDKTAKECWETCENYDWIFWWAARENIEKKKFVDCACKIARLVVYLDNSGKSILVIEATEIWIMESSESSSAVDTRWAASYAADAAYAANAAIRYAAEAGWAAHYAVDADSARAAHYAVDADAAIIKIIHEIIPQPWTEPETIELSLGDRT